MKKALKVILMVILIIVIIFVGVILFRYIRINNILNKYKENTSVSSYYIKAYNYSNDTNKTQVEIYAKDNKELLKLENYNILVDNDEQKSYFINDVDKTIKEYNLSENSYFVDHTLDEYVSSNFIEKLKYVFTWKIKSEKLNDVPSYHIEIEDLNIWLDKETMLEKKSITKVDSDTQTSEIEVYDINPTNIQDDMFDLNKFADYTRLENNN